jgi:hypothetical protein
MCAEVLNKKNGDANRNQKLGVVLYLDFDGVLHHDEVYWSRKQGIHIRAPGHRLFEWAEILEEILASYSEVSIVLATSWVRVKSYEFAKKRLSPALQSKVIGATFHRREMNKFVFENTARGEQIYADVKRRQPTAWLAIDNDDVGWPSHCRCNLIKTDDELGLSDTKVQAEIRTRLTKLTAVKV